MFAISPLGSRKALDGHSFVVERFEDHHEFRNDEQVANEFGEVQELQSSSRSLGGRISPNQLADARAVDKGDVAQIQHEVSATVANEAPDRFFQRSRTRAQCERSIQLEN